MSRLRKRFRSSIQTHSILRRYQRGVNHNGSNAEAFVYPRLVCWAHSHILKEELHAGVEALYVVQDVEEDPIKFTSWVIVSEHFTSKREALAGRASEKEVYLLPLYIPLSPFLHVTEMDGIVEVELRLLDSVLVDLAGVVPLDRHAKFTERYLPTTHPVKE